MNTTHLENYVTVLKQRVEDKLGHSVSTSRDFDTLAHSLRHSDAGYLSTSTLKRVWGYVRSSGNHHHSSLDILSRYIGFPGFEAFCRHCDAEQGLESQFNHDRVLDVFALPADTCVEVSWLPDRRLTLRHKGNCIFKIEASENSRLAKDMHVRCSRLVEGDRLMLDLLDEAGKPQCLYVAGKNNGITWHILET